MFWNKSTLESHEYQKLNLALIELERKVILLEMRNDKLEIQLRSFQGRFYQSKKVEASDFEEPKSEDSNKPTILIPV
jgi:hypothetical protein